MPPSPVGSGRFMARAYDEWAQKGFGDWRARAGRWARSRANDKEREKPGKRRPRARRRGPRPEATSGSGAAALFLR